MTQMIGIYIFPPAGPAFKTSVPADALGHLGHPQLVPQDAAAAQGPPPLLAQPATNLSSARCNSTLVTAYYKIRSKHSHAKYTTWMTNFLSLPDCLVVFVQPGLEDLVKALRPASLPTLVIPR